MILGTFVNVLVSAIWLVTGEMSFGEFSIMMAISNLALAVWRKGVE